MKYIYKISIVVMFGLLVLLSAQSSLAWSINPAKWTLYHKDDFEMEVYEWPMEMTNDGDSPITVRLSIIEPEYLYDGNSKFPNLEWISINKEEIEIPANSKERAIITMDITNTTDAYNQSWEFWILANQIAGSGNIRTDYKCRWTLQTPVRYVPIEERPGYVAWGTIAMYFGLIGGAFVLILAIYKKGFFSKRPTKEKEKPVSMREQNKIIKESMGAKKTKNNVIKYKKET